MTLPSNVVRSSEMEWIVVPAPAPFGGSVKEFPALALRSLGFHLEQVGPGMRSCPLHDHTLEEEQFYLLEGMLTVSERSPEGQRSEFELHAGELIVYPAGTRIAHAFANPGPGDAVFLAFSDRRPGDICTYPDSDKTNLRRSGIGVWQRRESPRRSLEDWRAQARARREREKVERLERARRPSHVVASAPEQEHGTGTRRFLGASLSRAGGARTVFLNRDRLPPGSSPSDLHRHRFNEEALLLLSGRLALRQQHDGRESSCALEPGDVVHWPAGGPAHQLRNESAEEASYLVFGTDRSWDVIELPERDEIYVAALGERGQLQTLEYYAGEVEE